VSFGRVREGIELVTDLRTMLIYSMSTVPRVNSVDDYFNLQFDSRLPCRHMIHHSYL
jgi:hypothetical protein